MLTDDDLRELLASAATQVPEPSPLPDDLFEFEPAPVRARRRIDLRAAIGPVLGVAACLLVVAGAIAWFGSLGHSESKTSASGAFSTAANSIGSDQAAGTGALQPSGGSTATGAGAGTGAVVPPIADTAKVIKTGDLELRVGKGTVIESVNRLTALATGLGGYVSSTKTSTSDQSGTQGSATITLRVPAPNFEQLLDGASKLGQVQSTTTSGQDVTAQFTDIDAQISALSATRDQLLVVLQDAKNVNDILAVQDRITQVQVQIDQLNGQKKLLTDQTSYGTLAVTVLEPNATASVTPEPDHNDDLGDAWRHARNSFVDGVEWIVSVSGTILLLALCAAVIGGAYRLVQRTLRRRALTL
jgi:hypothetical protein